MVIASVLKAEAVTIKTKTQAIPNYLIYEMDEGKPVLTYVQSNTFFLVFKFITNPDSVGLLP